MLQIQAYFLFFLVIRDCQGGGRYLLGFVLVQTQVIPFRSWIVTKLIQNNILSIYLSVVATKMFRLCQIILKC